MKAVTAALSLAAAVVPVTASAMPAPSPPPIPIASLPPADLAPTEAMSASLSSNRAGVRPVRVKVVLTYPMRCGQPGPGVLTLTFPSGERLPSRFRAAAILLNGHAASSAKRNGNRVTLALPRPRGMSCDVIVAGKLTVFFTREARLGNPARAGSYQLVARARSVVLRTMLQITPS